MKHPVWSSAVCSKRVLVAALFVAAVFASGFVPAIAAVPEERTQQVETRSPGDSGRLVPNNKDDSAAFEARETEDSATQAGRSVKAASPYAVAKTSTEVRQAIRQVLSSDERQRRQGRYKLETLGKKFLPEIRYWIRATRSRIDKIEQLATEIEGDGVGSFQLIGSADRFLDAKFEEATRLAIDGEFRQAEQLARAILLLDENRPQSWLVRQFIRDCQERLATTELLEPSFFVSRQVYEVGEIPELTFRLANRQDRQVVVYLDKGVLGEATVVVRLHFSNGEWKNSEVRVSVRANSPTDRIVLGPGRAWQRTVRFKLDEPMPLFGAVARVKFGGRFRPTRWIANDPNENLALPLASASFWIVPPSQAPLSDRPLQKMTAALLFNRKESFFVGGQLSVWAAEEDPVYNGKLVETLIRRLDALDEESLRHATWFLSQATGEDHEADPKRWVKWWNSHRRNGAGPVVDDKDAATTAGL